MACEQCRSMLCIAPRSEAAQGTVHLLLGDHWAAAACARPARCELEAAAGPAAAPPRAGCRRKEPLCGGLGACLCAEQLCSAGASTAAARHGSPPGRPCPVACTAQGCQQCRPCHLRPVQCSTPAVQVSHNHIVCFRTCCWCLAGAHMLKCCSVDGSCRSATSRSSGPCDFGMRRVVGCCFVQLKLAELKPADMQALMHALGLGACSRAGALAAAELRLRYFASTRALLQ
jgi:hypothetical protein